MSSLAAVAPFAIELMRPPHDQVGGDTIPMACWHRRNTCFEIGGVRGIAPTTALLRVTSAPHAPLIVRSIDRGLRPSFDATFAILAGADGTNSTAPARIACGVHEQAFSMEFREGSGVVGTNSAALAFNVDEGLAGVVAQTPDSRGSGSGQGNVSEAGDSSGVDKLDHMEPSYAENS